MSQNVVAILSRLAAGAAPQPAPLRTAPPLAQDVGSEGKKSKKKRKKRNRERQQVLETCQADLTACTSETERCAAQEGVCRTYVTAACGNDPGCPAVVNCCTHFRTCNSTGFLACLTGGGAPPQA